MPTTIPLITTIPTDPPSSADPANFDARADAFLGDFPPFAEQINDTAEGMNTLAGELEVIAGGAEAAAGIAQGLLTQALTATTRMATSASSFSLTAGTKTVHTAETGRGFAVNDNVVLWRRSDAETRAYGVVATSDGSDDYTVSISADGILAPSGTGPFSDWVMADAGFFEVGATAAEVWAMVSALVSLTPKSVADALAEVALVDAATIAVNLNAGFNFAVTLGGNRTLGNPTNTVPGKTGRIRIVQDGTGSRTLSYGANWEFEQGQVPTLSTAAGSVDYLDYEVVSSTSIRARLTRAWA